MYKRNQQHGVYTLPINIDHVVKSYTQYALPLCVVCTEENAIPWVLKNFTQIKSYAISSDSGNHMKYGLEDGFNHSVSGVDYSEVLEVELIELANIPDFISFAESSVRKGIYLHVSMDEFYLPPKVMYQQHHHIHPSLIFGVDEPGKRFNVAGFIKLFEIFELRFDDCLRAINEAIIVDRESNPLSHVQLSLYTYKPKKLSEVYPFSLAELRSIIEAHLHGGKEAHWIRGIHTYDIVLAYLEEPFHNGNFIKYNTVHLLSEHKHMLGFALRHVLRTDVASKEVSVLLNNYSQVVKLFDRVKYVFIENAAKNQTWPFIDDKNAAELIKKHLQSAVELEKKVLSDFLESF